MRSTINKTKYPLPFSLLPHSKTMLLVDKIVEYESGVSLTASSFVKESWIFFDGHFPNYPVLPGVVLLEMMFQSCGLFGRMELTQGQENRDGAVRTPIVGMAVGADKVAFKKPVYPNTNIRIKVWFVKKVMQFSLYKVKAYNDENKEVAKATVTVHLAPHQ